MTAPQGPCTRYPCDHAYPKWRHVPDATGCVMHFSRVGGSDSQGWSVATVAVDNGPWCVAIKLGDDTVWRLITDDGRYEQPLRRAGETVANVADLANALSTSVVRMASTWLLEDVHETEAKWTEHFAGSDAAV